MAHVSLTLSTVAEGCRELQVVVRVVGHDRDGRDVRRVALDAGRLAWQGSECRRQGQAALHTTHRQCGERLWGGTQILSFKKRQPRLFLHLRSHSVVQVVALMYHSTHITPSLMYHYTLMLRTIFFSFSSYTSVDFICRAYLLRHLTFLESWGGWVWLQGAILMSLSDSDNQTKLAFKLLSCDRLNFLDTYCIVLSGEHYLSQIII